MGRHFYEWVYRKSPSNIWEQCFEIRTNWKDHDEDMNVHSITPSEPEDFSCFGL